LLPYSRSGKAKPCKSLPEHSAACCCSLSFACPDFCWLSARQKQRGPCLSGHCWLWPPEGHRTHFPLGGVCHKLQAYSSQHGAFTRRFDMRTPARRVSGSRPRSKSSLSDNPTDSNQDSVTDGHPIPPSPAPSTTVPVIAQKSPPPDTPNPPRRNGRRRYTPRQVPFSASLHTAQPPSPTNPSHRNPPDNNVAQFVSLTQQLNGQMDGVVEYSLPGGQWER
jgi:hypothetical protein